MAAHNNALCPHDSSFVMALGRIMTLSFKMFLLCTCSIYMLSGHYLVNMITCMYNKMEKQKHY